eukprot:GFKZ01007159.1.p1 GENE.GFKZ01007159.1~~GFKZ01007159.1.p1  ORF type:complete len:566 (-),score=64.00 GFKZ01007159.1:576-2081(-)
MPFKQKLDELNLPYFRWESRAQGPTAVDLPVVEAPGSGSTSFLNQELQVNPVRSDNLFRRDLTANDDIILAILSLILLLLIQDIVTTILLRTHHGQISTFSFSVAHVMSLARDFHFRPLFRGPARRAAPKRHINLKLLIFALFVIFLTFGLEVAVLFLTNQELTPIRNNTLSFELRHPFSPRWQSVRYHNTASLNRPCIAISLVNVDQSKTRVSACVTSNLSTLAFGPFRNNSLSVQMIMQTDIHEYGAEHTIRVDGQQVQYSARAFFNLDDGRPRIMQQRTRQRLVRERVAMLHRQLVAIMFSAYQRETGDRDMNLTRLRQLDNTIRFQEDDDPPETRRLVITEITRDDGTLAEVAVNPRRFFTRVDGVIPVGEAAFQIAQQVFKSATAVSIQRQTGGNDTDLFVGEGLVRRRSVVWKESGRVLNVVSLVIIVAGTALVLCIMRMVLRPVATAEMAGLMVKKGVGAAWDRPPLLLADDEHDRFEVPWRASETLGAVDDDM